MKNIFGIDTTDNNNVVSVDGGCFISRKISPSLDEQLNSAFEDNLKMEKKARLPGILSLVKSLSFILAIMFTAGIIKADVPLSQAFENAPVIVVGAPVLLIFFIVLKIYEHLRMKKVGSSDELVDHLGNIEKLSDLAKAELGIPENNVEIDVLFTRYVVKNGKEKKRLFGLCSHYNQCYMMFVENGNLCISSMYERVDIPLSSLRSAVLSDKLRERASFSNWNKSEAYNSDTYKKHKITLNNQGSYFCGFYTVEIHDIKGDFCLLIPSYDFEAFSALTGIRSVEN